MKKHWKIAGYVGLLAAVGACPGYMWYKSARQVRNADAAIAGLAVTVGGHVPEDMVGDYFDNGKRYNRISTGALSVCRSSRCVHDDCFESTYDFEFRKIDMDPHEWDKWANDEAFYNRFVQEFRYRYVCTLNDAMGFCCSPDIALTFERIRKTDGTPVDFSTPVEAKDILIRVNVVYRGLCKYGYSVVDPDTGESDFPLLDKEKYPVFDFHGQPVQWLIPVKTSR